MRLSELPDVTQGNIGNMNMFDFVPSVLYLSRDANNGAPLPTAPFASHGINILLIHPNMLNQNYVTHWEEFARPSNFRGSSRRQKDHP